MAGFQSLELKPEFVRALAISLGLHAALLGALREPDAPEGNVVVLKAPPVGALAAPLPAPGRRSVPAARERTPDPSPSAAAPPRPVQAFAAIEEALDADGLRQYRIEIAAAARQFGRHAELARRSGLSGTAEVRVGVATDGRATANLARSSGHEALDDAAVEMLRGASARAFLPEPLRGRSFSVVLPVVFSLDGD